jgi:hypothetical protein
MVVLRITNSRYCCGRLQPLPAGFPPYTPTAILQRDFPINRMALSTLTKVGVMRRSRVKRKRNNAGSRFWGLLKFQSVPSLAEDTV